MVVDKPTFVLCLLVPRFGSYAVPSMFRAYHDRFLKLPGWRKRCQTLSRLVAGVMWSGEHGKPTREEWGALSARDLILGTTEYVGLLPAGTDERALNVYTTRVGDQSLYVNLPIACLAITDAVVSLTFRRPGSKLPGIASQVRARPAAEWHRSVVGERLVTVDYAAFKLVSALGSVSHAER